MPAFPPRDSQYVNSTCRLAREKATKNVERPSSGCCRKLYHPWSSRPTKITTSYSSPLLLWTVIIGM